jgi:hypothetical protein
MQECAKGKFIFFIGSLTQNIIYEVTAVLKAIITSKV